MSSGNIHNPRDEPHVVDILPEYIDNTLPHAERDQVRAHLEACADCHTEYADLRATTVLLSSMPQVAPPRVFTLTPEMVQPRESIWQRLLSPRNVPVYGRAMAALMVLFVGLNIYLSSQVNNTFSKIGSAMSGGGYSTSAEAPAPISPAANQEAARTTASEAAPTGVTAAAGAPPIQPTTGAAAMADPTVTTATSAMSAPPPGDSGTAEERSGAEAQDSILQPFTEDGRESQGLVAQQPEPFPWGLAFTTAMIVLALLAVAAVLSRRARAP